jgi:type III secretion protein Q
MNRLTALRSIDAETQGNVRARLEYLGYQPQETGLLADKLYLRFQATFEDGSEITGYIDKATWLSQSMPVLQGIDWLSVDENVLPSLIAAHPFQLSLLGQHASVTHCRIVELVKDVEPLSALPSLPATTGVVIIENLVRKISDALSDSAFELEMQDKLPVPLEFYLGRTVMPVQGLSSINVGDVLLVEQLIGHVKSRNQTLFKFELGEDSIMIIEHNDELLMDEIPQKTVDTKHAEEKNGINNLPIELSVVLLEKMVTIGELKAILPGEILNLPPDALMDVEIRANQRCFARGELIQLSSGQLGVEIRKIWP